MECPGVDLSKPILDKLGPRGIIGGDLDTFDLEIPNSGGSVEHINTLVVHAHNFSKQLKASAQSVFSCPLVFDTGASYGLSPFKSDFLDDYKSVNIDVKGVAGGGSIVGGGTILRRFKTRCGSTIHLPAHGYHMPKADIRLESPQSLIRAMGGSGHAIVKMWDIEWHLPDKRIIDIPIDPKTNLPLIHDFVCTSAEKTKFQDGFKSKGIHGSGLCVSCDDKPDPYDQYELKKAVLCCTSVADETNQNLDGAQKELLLWHQKLCINMQDLQQLMRPQNVRNHRGTVIYRRPPVVPTKFKRTAYLKRDQYPLCLACKLATAKAKSSDVVTSKPIASKEGALSRDQYEPGDNIATDQFVVKTAGRLLKGYVQETTNNCF